MTDSSPPRQPASRLGALRNFLPLNDVQVSTRGQTLPSLIQNRSIGNLKDFRAQMAQRRAGTADTTDGEEEGDTEGLSPAKSRPGRMERRMSNLSVGSEVLMTPQMRSMRLIGNNNPRYQWYVFWKGYLEQTLHQ